MIIIPIYNAEKFEFMFNTVPAVRFELWNKQIEKISMFSDEQETIPDAIAVFEGEVDQNRALEILEELGLNILPLIFEKAYYIYQVADEKHVFMKSSTSFSIFRNKGFSWIWPKQLQNFLDSATTNKKKYDLQLILGTRYEADFRANSVQVKCFLYSLILEMLTEKFIDKIKQSPLSEETLTEMLMLARNELVKKGKMDENLECSEYNLIKQNLMHRLNEKSNKEKIYEFLNSKCHLKVNQKEVGEMISLRGKIVHSGSFNFNKKDLQTYKNLDYVCRIALIISLLDFDENFLRYLTPHKFLGPKFIEGY